MEHKIDATNKSIGRVASEAAQFLMGKNSTSYARNIAPKVKVEIENASKMKILPSKREQKTYKRFSGYPGGLKETSMEKMIEKKGYAPLLEHAVHGMLPGNRLRDKMMKNLKITE